MSSVSGDEASESTGNETVRRTRSGRAVKVVNAPVLTVKKTPAKRNQGNRTTRAQKTVQENVEEENTMLEEESMPENGVQQDIEEQQDTAIETQIDKEESTMETDNNELDELDSLLQTVGEQTVQQTENDDENPMETMNEVQDNITIEQIVDTDTLMEQTETPQEVGSEDNIPEFDPEDVSQEDVSQEDVNQEDVNQEEQKLDDTEGNEISTQMNVDTVQATDGGEPIQEASQMMTDNEDDQCIVIEDDIDPNYGLDEHIEESNDSTKDNGGQRGEDVIEISDQESDMIAKKSVPGTEAVSEDELPTETAKEPETEAVSDDELPTAKIADLGETESVSDDELPVESEKKRKAKSQKVAEKKTKTTTTKRKRAAQGEYDPSSPTSENNDETPAKIKAISADDSSDKDNKPASPKKKSLPELEKYWKAVHDDPADFTGWTYLLQYVDQENDPDAARDAYEKFLQRYPYCYGYWRKYADYEKKKGDPDRVQTVFDQGLNAISLSVDLWLHYINFCKATHEKDEDKMREQYERAIKACGLEFRSDRLWESYIKWELEHKRLTKVMSIYDRLLTTPTQGYMSHFESFQEFVTANSPNKILSVDDFLELRAEVKTLLKSEDAGSDDAPPGEESPNDDKPPSDEETRMIREKIISSRRKMHKANVNAVAARWTFEEGIKRPYFHVKPLERCQLKNWKEYLDYEIEQKDHSRIVILFERCLIACALYDEFWMRFVRYLESQKGDNADKIRDVYRRACTVHHPKKPNLHLLWASFEEGMGNYVKAASILENIDSVTPSVLQIAYRRINLERRRGDLERAAHLYEHYIATSKNRTVANNIVVKYARFLCKVTNDIDGAIKVLVKATEKDKDNPRLFLQLVDLGLQRNPIDVQEVVGYMDLFIDRENTDVEQRLVFAQRKVEFLEDFGSDIRQVLKADEQFQKCIKQAKERKKVKTEEKVSEPAPPKKAKVDVSTPPVQPATYQYGSTSAPYQSQPQFQGGQYANPAGYQQGYQQYPPPSDPNYANYQNWQYSQSGPQAYPPYGQWGPSYNYY